MLGVPLQASGQELLQSVTASGNTGHHRAHRDGGNLGDFLVRQSFQLSKDNHLAKFQRQLFQGLVKKLVILLSKQELLRAGCLVCGRVNVLIEYRRRLATAVLLEPGETSVANDRQQPSSPRVAMKASKELDRPQGRFLDDVLGVVIVAGQPAREVIGRIQMRNDYLLEACEVIFGSQRSIFQRRDSRPTIPTRYAAMLFPKSM